MTTDDPDSHYPPETLCRMVEALGILVACIHETVPERPELRQTHELLTLWSALPSEESREGVLALLREAGGVRPH